MIAILVLSPLSLQLAGTNSAQAAAVTAGLTLSTAKVTEGYSSPVNITVAASGGVTFDTNGTDVKVYKNDVQFTSATITDINVASSTSMSFTIGTGLAAGNYQFKFLKSNNDTYYADFQIVTPSISLGTTSIPSGYASSVAITVIGTNTNFTSGQTTVTILNGSNNATGKAGTPTISSATSLSFQVATGLAAGSYTVRVSTPGKETVSAALTVRNQSVSISPASATQGYNSVVSVTVTGASTTFTQADTSVSILRVSDNSVAATASNVSVTSNTALTFSIPTGLTGGQYTIRITTGLEVATATFTVNVGSIQSLTENSQTLSTIVAGYSSNKTIIVNGENTAYSSSTTVTLKNSGGTDFSHLVSGVTPGGTTLTFNLATGLGAGTYTVTTTTNGVTATSPSFTVILPTLTSNLDATAFSKDYASAKTVTVSGTNTSFQQGTTTVSVKNADTNQSTGLTSAVGVASGTSLSFSLGTGIAAGNYKVCTSTAGTEICSANTFTVTAASASITPSAVTSTSNVVITVTGINTSFSGTTTVQFLNTANTVVSGVTVSPSVTSATSMTVSLTASSALTVGTYKLRISTSNATINETVNVNFTVVSESSPIINIQGAGASILKEGYSSTTFTIAGTNTTFTTGSTVLIDDMAVTSFNASNATSMTVTLPTGLTPNAGPPKSVKDYTLSIDGVTTTFQVIPVMSIAVSNAAVSNTIAVDATLQLAATATYSDNTTAAVTSASSITWSSNDTDVVSVSGAGLVTAVGIGTATISAIYYGVTDTYEVTVTESGLPDEEEPVGTGIQGGGAPSSNLPVGTDTTETLPLSDGVKLGEDSVTLSKEVNAMGVMINKIEIKEEALDEAFNLIKNETDAEKKVVTIEVIQTEKIAKVEIPGNALSNAALTAKGAILNIKSDKVSYRLPVNVIDLKTIATNLGTDVQNVKVNVIIEQVSGVTSTNIQTSAKQSGIVLLVDPVEFSITVESDGKTVTVDNFGTTYVTRSFELSGTVDASRTTGVVIDGTTGKASFVPTVFVTVDGITQAIIKRTGNSIYSVVEAKKTFGDMGGFAWAKNDIEQLASKLIVSGVSDTQFDPQRNISRAEFSALINRALGLLPVAYKGQFKDVDSSKWYAVEIQAAYDAKIISGKSADQFDPDAPITRQEMITLIGRAANFAGQYTEPKSSEIQSSLTKFTDQGKISDFAKVYAAYAVQEGIMLGVTETTFAPTDTATRAQAVAVLARMLRTIGFINK